MTEGLPAEGCIDIGLSVADGRIASVDIRNHRNHAALVPLIGHSAEDGVRLLTRLYSVCRIAQGLAGAAAVEQAAGLRVGAIQDAARSTLLMAETVLEHASRAALDWPLLLGEPPDVAAVKILRAALADFHRDLYPDGDWMCPGGGRLMVDGKALAGRAMQAGRCLREAVFGGEAPLNPEAWQQWVAGGKTPAARLVAKLRADGLAGFGASLVTALPDLDSGTLDARLAADDGAFAARPDWLGSAHETGPLTRSSNHPLVAAILCEQGAGIEARIAARLVELDLTAQKMQDYLLGLCNDNGSMLTLVTGHGLGIVEAARGRLIHRVELQEGCLARYQILAPTEWNFHPAGALAQGLVGAPAGADPAYRARLLVAALDPCVATRVRVL
ncbi:MAG TPA: nickel-dependent hydrogenase large subunit [Patescibacteria group bacterium]|nr:nickel-dependent hydrogenase large subunit [Patescibacteria group bacterium]